MFLENVVNLLRSLKLPTKTKIIACRIRTLNNISTQRCKECLCKSSEFNNNIKLEGYNAIVLFVLKLKVNMKANKTKNEGKKETATKISEKHSEKKI